MSQKSIIFTYNKLILMRKSALSNFITFTGGIFSIYISYITATGDILNYIDFAGPLNEMAFCIMSFILGIGLIYTGIPTRHWKTLRKKLFPYTISISIKFKKKYHPTGMTMKTWNQKFRNHPNY